MRKCSGFIIIIVGSFLFSVCAKKTPVSSKDSPAGKASGTKIIAILTAPRTFTSAGDASEDRYRKQLAESIAQATGQKTLLLEYRYGVNDAPTALVQAAAKGGDILIFLQHPGGVPDGFVGATALNVTSGEIFGDTAVTRESPKAITNDLANWAEGMQTIISQQSPLDLSALVKRLRSEEACKQVVAGLVADDFSSGGELQELEALYDACHQQEGVGKGSKRLFVRLLSVPPKDQPLFTDQVHNSDLEKIVRKLSKGANTLVIVCDNDCAEGVIRLDLWLDIASYRFTLQGGSNYLKPFKQLAGELLRYRQLVVNRAASAQKRNISRFSTEILINGEAPKGMKVKVTGSPGSPKLKADDAVRKYLKGLG